MSFFSALQSGSTIGLQLYNQRWLSLAPSLSTSASCPGTVFNTDDWTRCWGEVFQIYRMKGSGTVRSGDTVGIYYPREKNWFSMSTGRGHKEGCPGTPNINTGFNKDNLWLQCWGEVFIVYAEGKSNGEEIKAGNRLAFFFPADPSHVSFQTDKTTLDQCMRRTSDNNPMPPACGFAACIDESVRLTIRP